METGGSGEGTSAAVSPSTGVTRPFHISFLLRQDKLTISALSFDNTFYISEWW
jgi:hypothetical protein